MRGRGRRMEKRRTAARCLWLIDSRQTPDLYAEPDKHKKSSATPPPLMPKVKSRPQSRPHSPEAPPLAPKVSKGGDAAPPLAPKVSQGGAAPPPLPKKVNPSAYKSSLKRANSNWEPSTYLVGEISRQVFTHDGMRLS